VTTMRIGIDSGGTFTDFVVLDGPERHTHKTPSTPRNPADAVVNGLGELADLAGVELRDYLARVGVIVHGTTVATNALLTGSGARVGFICSNGWRDVLFMRDGTREDPYDNRFPKPEPPVPRWLCRPVRGRLDADGHELEPLHTDDVLHAADVFAAAGVDAVAVCLLHSWLDDAHERSAVELLQAALPGTPITRSAELVPLVGYWDRASTSVINAALVPIIQGYLDSLVTRLTDAGFGGNLVMMQSNGGVADVDEVRSAPVRLVLSGPAGAPVGGAAAAAAFGWDGCITSDMGGTSFDCSIVEDGRALIRQHGQIGGVRLALPMLDIHTVGAGGGSIASVTPAGLLRVGPESAGADPGPACYGRGGTKPTVTDADLLLGYIDPARFLDGRMGLDVDAAERALSDGVARPLGMETARAAAGIYDVVNVAMATAIRRVTVDQGLDPRRYPLVVAGGAGAVHAAAIARELGITSFIVPADAAVFCAAGMVAADFQHDTVASHRAMLAALATDDVARIWGQMRADGFGRLQREGIDPGRMWVRPSLDLRYRGQFFELTVDLPAEMVERPDAADIATRFHALHERLFGFCSPDGDIEVLNARLAVGGDVPLTPATIDADRRSGDAIVGERTCWSAPHGAFRPLPVIDTGRLLPNDPVDGPAIVELTSTAAVIPEGMSLTLDHHGSLVVFETQTRPDIARRIDAQLDA
jgi:N-methylhydantoinase A